MEGGDAPWQLNFHVAAAQIRFDRPVSLAANQNPIDMKYDTSATIRDQIDELYRSESRRVFASLVRLLNDFDLADDAMHEAYAAAVEIWQQEGVPANPRTWLISTGKFKAINSLRRQGRLTQLQPGIA